MDATMIDKKLSDKGIQFEMSMGNAGNTIDGQPAGGKEDSDAADSTGPAAGASGSTGSAAGVEDEALLGTWNSTTPSVKPLSHDRMYYFLPYWDDKPTMYIRNGFPDHRRRMYQSNVISKMADILVRIYIFVNIS